MLGLLLAMIAGAAGAFLSLHGGLLDLQRQVGDLRTEVHQEIGGLRADLGGQIGGLRTDLEGQIGGLRADLAGLSSRMTRLETIVEVHFGTLPRGEDAASEAERTPGAMEPGKKSGPPDQNQPSP